MLVADADRCTVIVAHQHRRRRQHFDLAVGGEKTLTLVTSVRAEYRLGYNLTLTANAQYDMADTSDLRADYDRSQASLGVRWEW